MDIEKALKDYGLTEKQAKVYLACLELDSATVQKISQKAGLVRTTVYEVLEILRQKGFINTFLKKRIKYFNAEDPRQVVRFAQNKVDALKNTLPELEGIAGQSRNRPSLRFYQGKDGMKLILEEILNEAKELIAFGSAEDLFRELGDYFPKFVEQRIKNKIPLRVILQDSEKARERKRLGPEQLRQVKLIADKYGQHGLIYVWKNKVAMFSFIHDFVAVVVESHELAELQNALLNNLWDLLCLQEFELDK